MYDKTNILDSVSFSPVYPCMYILGQFQSSSLVLTLCKERELREREEKRTGCWPVKGNPHVFLLSLWLPDLTSFG